jgi:hypothetical protein
MQSEPTRVLPTYIVTILLICTCFGLLYVYVLYEWNHRQLAKTHQILEETHQKLNSCEKRGQM